MMTFIKWIAAVVQKFQVPGHPGYYILYGGAELTN
jgi:hypothetical protein